MTWMGIKQIITTKPQCSHSPSKLKNNETEITDATRIANELNEFFANVGTNLANKISSVDATPADYLPPNLTSNFYIFPTSASEIEEEILNLKSKKASGPFSIPTKILKLLRDLLSKPLEILYNHSFSSGIVPDQFKIARVILVFKKVSQFVTGNYRPMSLLSIFNRILEKLMYKRLLSYINKNNILYD